MRAAFGRTVSMRRVRAPPASWYDVRFKHSGRKMFKCTLPTPHQSKLIALSQNRKLPDVDKPRVEKALQRYAAWVQAMDRIEAHGNELLQELACLVNAYKRSVEVDLIYDSPADFLYRQKG